MAFHKMNLFFKLLFGKSLKLINGIGTGSNTTVYKKKRKTIFNGTYILTGNYFMGWINYFMYRIYRVRLI